MRLVRSLLFRDMPLKIAARHGVPADQVVRVPGGVANDAYLLGDRLFLRVARPGFGADLAKESVVIPAARAVGVVTPAVVEAGAGFLVTERVPGHDLATVELPPDARQAVLTRLGRELALLHGIGSLAGLQEDVPGDPRVRVDRMATEGYLDADTARWLIGWFERLARDTPARAVLHGDVAPQNVMIVDGEYGGLVDWGDACVGETGMEFAKLRLADVVHVVAGYGDEGVTATALRYHLDWALTRIADATPVPGQRHWTAPPASRLLEVLRFFAEGARLG